MMHSRLPRTRFDGSLSLQHKQSTSWRGSRQRLHKHHFKFTKRRRRSQSAATLASSVRRLVPSLSGGPDGSCRKGEMACRLHSRNISASRGPALNKAHSRKKSRKETDEERRPQHCRAHSVRDLSGLERDRKLM